VLVYAQPQGLRWLPDSPAVATLNDEHDVSSCAGYSASRW
jgi:hypothetical protein